MFHRSRSWIFSLHTLLTSSTSSSSTHPCCQIPCTNEMDRNSLGAAGGRYEPSIYENDYRVVMRLTIKSVEMQDFSSYRCVAKNSLGETDGVIKLYRKWFPITRPKLPFILLSQLVRSLVSYASLQSLLLSCLVHPLIRPLGNVLFVSILFLSLPLSDL